jgi:hypothetical protein
MADDPDIVVFRVGVIYGSVIVLSQPNSAPISLIIGLLLTNISVIFC